MRYYLLLVPPNETAVVSLLLILQGALQLPCIPGRMPYMSEYKAMSGVSMYKYKSMSDASITPGIPHQVDDIQSF